MQSVFLGLLAAVLWGLHDFTVRRVSSKADTAALFLVVLGAGTAVLFPFAIVSPGWTDFSPQLLGFVSLTGLIYAFGVYALFRAFTIGPVRLVAPICGAYPVLSVGFAMMMGQPAGLAVWAAVLTVLIGITVMAQSEGGTPVSDKRGAVGWSVAAALGFAISFGMLHSAALQAADLPVTFVARFVGFCGVLVWVISQRITIKPALALWPTLLLMGVLDMGGMIAVTSAGGFARPEFAAVSSSCFGLVTILLAWRFLGERLSLLQVFGGASIFAGIAALGLL